MIFRLQQGIMYGANPPVATTVSGWPSSASTRSANPSSMAAVPNMAPLFSAVTVFAPIRCSGGSGAMGGSCAVPALMARRLVCTPGTMNPPRNTFLSDITLYVVAVPRSTVMQGRG